MALSRDVRATLAARANPAAWARATEVLARWHDAVRFGWLVTSAGPVFALALLPSMPAALRPYLFAANAWSALWLTLIATHVSEHRSGGLRWQTFNRRVMPAFLIIGSLLVVFATVAYVNAEPATFAGTRAMKDGGEVRPEYVTLQFALTASYTFLLVVLSMIAALLPAPFRVRLAASGLVAVTLSWAMGTLGLTSKPYWALFMVLSVGWALVSLLLEVPFLATGITDFENSERAKAQAKRRRERELEVAATIQSSMNPPPTWHSESGIHITSYQLTHKHVGGDWLAVRETQDGRVIALVLDVTGKGVQAALVAHAAQSVWAMSLSDPLFNPEHFLLGLNTTLCRLSSEKVHTATAGILEIDGPRLTYWSAAHCPVHVIWRDGTGESARRLRARGDMLGMRESLRLKPAIFEVPESAEIHILHASDGIFDGLALSPLGGQDLLARLEARGPECIAEIPVEDDKTLLWIRFMRKSGGEA